ncbi:MAG: zinc ribbon domain-containing protein [Thermodesulfobacteriota bacterium]
MKCPKCGLEQPETNIECPRCGVIFSKLTGRSAPSLEVPYQDMPSRKGSRTGSPVPALPEDPLPMSETRREPTRRAPESRGPVQDAAGFELEENVEEGTEEAPPEPRRLDGTDLLLFGIGAVLALASVVSAFIRNTFSTAMILVHEMGHSIFGWIYGYPSLPAFDFVYGGGMTLHIDRSYLLLGVIYALLVWAIWFWRKNTAAIVVLIILGVIHALTAFSRTHEVIILFMGHGTELAIAAIFIYRALSGAAVVHTAERPLYAAVGLFIVFYDLSFAYALMTSADARALYGEAKGGGHWMDFSRIAQEYLHTKLSTVARFFLLCCLLPIPVGYFLFRYQEYLRNWIGLLARRTTD